mgnify:CR=1 FL=1
MYNCNRHVSGDLKASASVAIAASKTRGWLYRGIYANAVCVVDVIDQYGTVVNVTIPAGSTYWLLNHGVQTGGTTSAAAGDFNYLYDGADP